MAENEFVRVEIGLDGGQIQSILVTRESADGLSRGARARAPQGALTLQAQDGTILLVLSRVTYAKRFAREGRVGFGD